MPRAPDLTIIILVTASTERLVRCLDSVRAAALNGGPSCEVLVLANATPAGALVEISAREDIVLIRSPVNLGFGGGANWAARFARGQHLVFLNDDATVTPGWLAALIAIAERDSSVGVIGCRVLRPDGRLQEVGSVLWQDGSVWGVGRLLAPDDRRLMVDRDVDYVSFCAAMVRRDAWESLGGLDEVFYPAYYEDADLCLRAQAAGWRVICTPRSTVMHDEGSSSSARYRAFLSERSRQQFVGRWFTQLKGLAPRPPDHEPAAMTAAALASLQARSPVPRTSLTSSERRPPRDRAVAAAGDGPDEAAALDVERRSLEAQVALLADYAATLDRELDELSFAALATWTLRSMKRRVLAMRSRGSGRGQPNHRAHEQPGS